MTDSTQAAAGRPAGGDPAGTSMAASGATPIGHSWALEPAVAPGPAPGYAYVGFWRRVAAWLIDGLILTVVYFVVAFLFLFLAMTQIDWSSLEVDPVTGQLLSTDAEVMAAFGGFVAGIFVLYGLIFLLVAGYHVLLWTFAGGTIGQRALGMEVRRESDGSRIGFWRACLRYVGLIISWWALGIGLLWVGIDERKQGWHDKLASTFVVRRV